LLVAVIDASSQKTARRRQTVYDADGRIVEVRTVGSNGVLLHESNEKQQKGDGLNRKKEKWEESAGMVLIVDPVKTGSVGLHAMAIPFLALIHAEEMSMDSVTARSSHRVQIPRQQVISADTLLKCPSIKHFSFILLVFIFKFMTNS
jgi:hypothetical protein